MFSFILSIIIYLFFIFTVYSYFTKFKMNILDFITIIFLSNIYIILLLKDYNPIIGLFITIIILLLRKIFILISTHYPIDYQKQILINQGNINFKALINNKYSYTKLIHEIKKKGFKDFSKIDYCILYQNELLVFTNKDQSYPLSLIIDGKIINNNLISINKTYAWLMNHLNSNNLSLTDVNYAFYKDKNIYFIRN